MDISQWLEHIQRQHPKTIELGLDRVRAVAQRMGLTRPAQRVITVAGTNGKGSTVAFLEAIARAAGLHVGAYTSPHLRRYNERVRIDGEEASDAALVAGFETVEAARVLRRAQDDREVPLTYFEYGTLAALWLFQREALDLAVLEVGLGGRLDAVNLVDADVAVITTVDIDHTDWLGAEREAIGAEKAGIMRAGRPVVLGDRDPPSSVLRHAYALGASAIRAGCDFFVDPRAEDDPPDIGWRWREPGTELALPPPRLDAPAQRNNAAMAIAALRALDLEISGQAIRTGVAEAELPGRLQRLVLPVPDGTVELVLDVGHNPQAARQLADWLAERPVAGRNLALFAALADKDAAGIAAALHARIDAWWLAGLAERSERGLSAPAFAARLEGALAGAEVAVCTDVPAALDAARAAARPGDRLLVFGSFLTVEAALQALAD